MPLAPALHFLIPFSRLPQGEGDAVRRGVAAPALAALLSRAALAERTDGDGFQRTLPHERWMAHRFGVTASAQVDAAPLAPYAMLADGGVPGAGRWACVEPVHVHIARDHLILIGPQALALDTAEAVRLLDTARPLFEEAGLTLAAPTPLRWYLSGAALGELNAASPLRAAGRNIEIWLPHEAATGERSRAWMRYQNEVQMAWFEHPVNQGREARGLPTSNSLWLYGQGRMQPVRSPFAAVLSNTPALRGLALAAQARTDGVPGSARAMAQTDSAAQGVTLVELDALQQAFLEEDWGTWQATLAELDTAWFGPALEDLRGGAWTSVSLTFAGDGGCATYVATRGDGRRFWRTRRNLADVLTD